MSIHDSIESGATEQAAAHDPGGAPRLRKLTKKLAVGRLVEVAAAVALSCWPSPAQGQEVLPSPGEEVRVRWTVASPYSHTFGASQFAIAEVIDVNPAHILVRRGQRMITIPLASVRTLERRVGTKPASAPAMVAGSALGFLAGFAAGALKGYADPTVAGEEVVDSGIVSGVLLGAPAGALVAYLASRRRGIYERIPLRSAATAVSWTADGRVGIAVRLPGS